MRPPERDEEEEDGRPGPEDVEVFEAPLDDVLDLHGFLPKDVAEVVRGYLDEAFAAGFEGVRLIHGKGIGVQREIVRKLLERDGRVASFGDAPAT
ncbi:MAG TPA: Smr/MutS family protein, partial [Thermoanaerobaculia bacterium]|nr:Smr/MutS family protein [Thermoanaerobaculia bacterium]